MKKTLNKQNGSIVVEASFVLPFFIFAVITIIMLILPCIAQAKISQAMNQAAYEYGQSYYEISKPATNPLSQQVKKFFDAVQPQATQPNNFDVAKLNPRSETAQIAKILFKKKYNGDVDDAKLEDDLTAFGISNLSFVGSNFNSSQGIINFGIAYDIAPFNFLGLQNIKFHQYKLAVASVWRNGA